MGRIPGWQTQAVYPTVAALMTEETPDTIIISQPSDTYVCLGYHQQLDHVFDRKVCVEKEIPILRRKVGGGGTYLDSNQLFYQCVFHQSRVPKDSKKVYEQRLTPVVNTLKHFFDVKAELKGSHEVELMANGLQVLVVDRLETPALWLEIFYLILILTPWHLCGAFLMNNSVK